MFRPKSRKGRKRPKKRAPSHHTSPSGINAVPAIHVKELDKSPYTREKTRTHHPWAGTVVSAIVPEVCVYFAHDVISFVHNMTLE